MTTAPPAEKAARRPADGALAVLRAAPRPVRYVLAGVLVNQLGAFVQSFLVLYLLHQGFTEQQGGIALGCYSVGAVAGSLAGGELTRRLGPRRTIVLSMFGSALLVVSISLVGRPSAFPLLLAVTVLAGLAAQTYRPAAGSLLSDLTPADRQVMVMSLFRIAMNTGGTLGPLLASWLLLIDWNLLFWANGVAAACYGVIALLLLPRTTAAGRPANVPQAGTEPTAGYRALLGDGRFVLYLTAMGFSALIYAQYFAVLPLKLTEDGHSTVLYSAVLTISGAMVVGCELFVTKYVQRWRAGTAGGVGLALLGLGLAGYALPDWAVLVLLMTLVGVLGQIINGPTMFAHPTRLPASLKSRGLAMSQAAWGSGIAIGPTLGVLAWSRLGNGVWLVCGLLGGLAALAAVRGLSRPESAGPRPSD